MLLLGCVLIFSDNLDFPFEPEVIPVRFRLTKNLVQTEVRHDTNQPYHIAFSDRHSSYEIRYILFGISKKVKIFDDLEILYPLFAQSILLNIAGEEKNILSTSNLTGDMLNYHFHASKAFQCSLLGRGSKFTKEYDFIIISFYFNEKYGIVCQTLLYNDPKITTNPQLEDDLASFQFPEK